jgi:hypothetical protein
VIIVRYRMVLFCPTPLLPLSQFACVMSRLKPHIFFAPQSTDWLHRSSRAACYWLGDCLAAPCNYRLLLSVLFSEPLSWSIKTAAMLGSSHRTSTAILTLSFETTQCAPRTLGTTSGGFDFLHSGCEMIRRGETAVVHDEIRAQKQHVVRNLKT